MKDGAGVASQRPGRGGGGGGMGAETDRAGTTSASEVKRQRFLTDAFRFRQHLFRRLSQFRLVADVKSTCGFLRICSGIILVN